MTFTAAVEVYAWVAFSGFIILNKVQPKEIDNNSLKDRYIK
jgi:hypothetical protein